MRSMTFCVLVVFLSSNLAGDDLLQSEDESTPDPPNKVVEVEPQATDEQIQIRIRNILEATTWYDEIDVRVQDGVVFLEGVADSEKHQLDATQLAASMEGAVFPINNIVVRERSPWDFSPAFSEMQELIRSFVRGLPFFGAAIVVLIITWFASMAVTSLMKWFFALRIENFLLKKLLAQTAGIVVIIVGVYLVLRVSGLTNLAVTVLGGTGVAGIVLGFAFRDIAENFLASLLVSLQTPFQKGDLIEVEGQKGFVQRVTTRGTVLMTFEGTYVQIPNSMIYKSVIRNYTANHNVRQEFVIGIDYEDSISEAQILAMQILADHPAVLNDPQSMVLVKELGASTVNLGVYFWVNNQQYSVLKVRSAIIRQMKQAFLQAGLVLPDEAREIIFPRGIPIHTLEEQPPKLKSTAEIASADSADATNAAAGEGNLSTEADDIKKQADESRDVEQGVDILQEPQATKDGE